MFKNITFLVIGFRSHRRRSPDNNNKGFTFVEVLIAVSLIAVISLTLYHALSTGLKVWERTRPLVVEEDVAIFLDKINVDLRNAFHHAQIGFQGDSTRFSFPTVISVLATQEDEKEPEYVDQLGAVEYYFDLTNNALYRREANYSQATKQQFGAQRLLVSSVSKTTFKYYYLTETGELVSKTVLDTLPAGIAIEIEILDDLGQRVMEKYINIPLDS